MDDEKVQEWLRDDIKEIKDSLKSLNDKFEEFAGTSCPNRHINIENRLTKLETRIYLICGGITFFICIVAQLIGGWLGRG